MHGKLENDAPELKVTGVNGLVEAGANDISFAVPPHVEHCHLSKAGVMVLGFDDPALPDNRPVIRVEIRVPLLPLFWNYSATGLKWNVL